MGRSKKNQQKDVICQEYFKEGKLIVKEICGHVAVSRAT